MAVNELATIKAQKWFYEFVLPDGTKTESYLPELARQIHVTREKALRQFLMSLNGNYDFGLDVSCHEGYYSHVLGEKFPKVVGIDKNGESVAKAKQITNLLGYTQVSFECVSLEDCSSELAADFVLCYGLLYHVENPIQILRKLALLARKFLCIETQVLPFQITGPVENGSYLWQRDLRGLFGICTDYPHSREGGVTDVALVPSLDALLFLLKQFGFNRIDIYRPSTDDYEQFVRGSRVIVYAER